MNTSWHYDNSGGTNFGGTPPGSSRFMQRIHLDHRPGIVRLRNHPCRIPAVYASAPPFPLQTKPAVTSPSITALISNGTASSRISRSSRPTTLMTAPSIISMASSWVRSARSACPPPSPTTPWPAAKSRRRRPGVLFVHQHAGGGRQCPGGGSPPDQHHQLGRCVRHAAERHPIHHQCHDHHRRLCPSS